MHNLEVKNALKRQSSISRKLISEDKTNIVNNTVELG